MKDKQVIEWATFRLKDGIDTAALLAASEKLQNGFLKQQKGFVRRDLVKTAEGLWADVVYWTSHEHAEQAMQSAMNNLACLEYFELLVGPDHDDPSVGVSHFEVLKSYS